MAGLAQLVERQFCKLDVAGSIPATGTITHCGSTNLGVESHMIEENIDIVVVPRYGDKRVRKSNGRSGWLYNVLLGYRLMSGGVHIMSIRKSEKGLDRWRFKNFSRDVFEYKVNVEFDGIIQFDTYYLPWLRYETDRWSVRLHKAGYNVPASLTIYFENPKDAVVFKLYQEEIANGQKTANKKKRKVTPL